MRSCLVAGVTPRLQKVNNRPSGYETDMFQAGGVTPTIVAQAELKMPAGQQEHGSHHLPEVWGENELTVVFCS